MSNIVKFPKKPVRKPPQMDPLEWAEHERAQRRRTMDVIIICLGSILIAVLLMILIIKSY